MRLIHVIAAATVSAFVGFSSQAAVVIQPTAVMATSEFTFGPMPASNLINASEFNPGDVALIANGASVPGTWPMAQPTRPGGSYGSGFPGFGNETSTLPKVVFDLGAFYDITSIALWNGQETAGYWTAVEDVNAYAVSSYGLTVPGSGANALLFNISPNVNAANGPQIRALTLTNTRYILLDVISGQDPGIIGLAGSGHAEFLEVRFVGDLTVIPEPTSLALIGASGLLALRRRRA